MKLRLKDWRNQTKSGGKKKGGNLGGNIGPSAKLLFSGGHGESLCGREQSE